MTDIDDDAPVIRRWRHLTIEGHRRVLIDGCEYSIPGDAEVKVTRGSGIEFAHIRWRGRVVIVTRWGEWDRSEEDAQRDAMAIRWRELCSGESV